MKEAYLKLLELLMPTVAPNDPKLLWIYEQLKKIQWIDLDKNQLENYEIRPAVAFPCVLLTVDVPRADDIGSKSQRCMFRVRVRVAYDFTGETSADNNMQAIAEGLEYVDLSDAVYQNFQGAILEGLGKLSRTAQVDEPREDGIKVMSLEFQMGAIDQTAA